MYLNSRKNGHFLFILGEQRAIIVYFNEKKVSI